MSRAGWHAVTPDDVAAGAVHIEMAMDVDGFVVQVVDEDGVIVTGDAKATYGNRGRDIPRYCITVANSREFRLTVGQRIRWGDHFLRSL